MGIGKGIKMKISYSNGMTKDNQVAIVCEDLSVEKPGFYRAFWADSPDSNLCSPVFGLGSQVGSYRKIQDVVTEFKRLYPNEKIFYKGKIK